MTEKTRMNIERLSNAERKEIVRDLYVDRTVAKEIFGLIDEARQLSKYLPEPICLMLEGDSGLGKTTILRQYAKKYPAERVQKHWFRPVLYVSLRPYATLDAAASEILRMLNVPGYDKGSRYQKINLIDTQIKSQQVDAVLIDECQSIVEASGTKTLYKVGDFFKHLAKESHKPLVLTGMKSILEALNSNVQLKALCSPHHIDPFRFDGDDNRKAFRKFLRDIDNQLPFEDYSRLSDIDLSRRLFVASDGNTRITMILIRASAIMAIDENKPKIEMSDLAKIYQRFFMHLGSNPFIPE